MRSKALLLSSEIARDLPTFTRHDEDHLDPLWEIADMLAEGKVELNPAAAFVFGAALLCHDLAMSRAAYALSEKGLRDQPEWPDRIAAEIRRQYGRLPHPSELVQPPDDVARSAEDGMLRDLHARQAEDLPLGHWRGLDGSEHYLIADPELRSRFGRLIGRLAASHHWDRETLPQEFSNPVGAPSFAPADWKVDPLAVACLLRAADAAHLDGRRAPDILAAVRQITDGSLSHWVFQNRMAKPYLANGKLIFTALGAFSEEDIDSWWLAFETVGMVDVELRGIANLLLENGRVSLSADSVAGADSPRAFGRLVECVGWEPVDTRVQVTDVANLVRRLGGKELYGRDVLAPIREIVVNACDAVKAKRALQDYRGRRAGSPNVYLAMFEAEDGIWLEVSDNGIGMTPEVMTGPLLDFGCSSWLSNSVAHANPGLIASQFSPTGKFGIGFFSIFMLGDRVQVISRSLAAGREDTWVLEFGDGLSRRPIMRRARSDEMLDEAGTTVRVLIDQDFIDFDGNIEFYTPNPFYSGKNLSVESDSLGRIVRYLLPASEANIWVKEPSDNDYSQVLAQNDWVTVGGDVLLARILGGWSGIEQAIAEDADDILLDVIRHYSPKLDVVTDNDGSIVGRFCATDELVIKKIGWAGWHASVVTAGPGRTGTGVFGVVGLLVGEPSRAARDEALPVITSDRIAKWATGEVEKAEARQIDHDSWWWADTFAEAMRVLGGDYTGLPMWEVGEHRLTEVEIREWLRSRDEVIEVHPVHRLIRVGTFSGYADPVPNSVWFEDGARPALHDATRMWPLADADDRLNPGSLFEAAISEAWEFPLEQVHACRRAQVESKRKGKPLKVATYNGGDILADAVVLSRTSIAAYHDL
ncbi:hypothetical protein HH310_06930 [Actinoplanes sp. TBRC 11911]|uniref:HD domain-containing protein n=1 Tax=Actinoplanes sp. TBRC 11911 TaxID=2729386 RepID=UPI00145EC2E1|nr:ATP-binding protein [Actinoplanes sp. TBRC 11911]NMO50925.1 hypothetical protein [Actinoplanes sp. TBRC 11911]